MLLPGSVPANQLVQAHSSCLLGTPVGALILSKEAIATNQDFFFFFFKHASASRWEQLEEGLAKQVVRDLIFKAWVRLPHIHWARAFLRSPGEGKDPIGHSGDLRLEEQGTREGINNVGKERLWKALKGSRNQESLMSLASETSMAGYSPVVSASFCASELLAILLGLECVHCILQLPGRLCNCFPFCLF